MTMLSIDVQIIHSEENDDLLEDSLQIDSSCSSPFHNEFLIPQNSPNGSDSGCSSREKPEKVLPKAKKRGGGWPKGKKRKAETVASSAPKAPSTGYVLFMSERRKIMKETNPELEFGQVTKLLGNEWSHLAQKEKKSYLVRAELDKQRYREELKAFQPDELRVTDDLYCKICDVLFVNLHNKTEHLYGKTHLANLKLETSKKTLSNSGNVTNTDDLTHAMQIVADLNTLRQSELERLRLDVPSIKRKQADLRRELQALQELKGQRQTQLDDTKLKANSLSTQLINLRNVPKLFGVINF